MSDLEESPDGDTPHGTSPEEYVKYHKDGTVWAKGQKVDGVAVGYWEWFRKSGTKMRSGWFDDEGEPTGEWTTYDQDGEVYKVTDRTPKSK